VVLLNSGPLAYYTGALSLKPHPPALFALDIFEIESHFYVVDLRRQFSFFSVLHSWNDSHMPPGPAFYWLRWSLMSFLPRLASNQDSPDLFLLNSWDYRLEPLLPAVDSLVHFTYRLSSSTRILALEGKDRLQ
jgi:hypothetical protein